MAPSSLDLMEALWDVSLVSTKRTWSSTAKVGATSVPGSSWRFEHSGLSRLKLRHLVNYSSGSPTPIEVPAKFSARLRSGRLWLYLPDCLSSLRGSGLPQCSPLSYRSQQSCWFLSLLSFLHQDLVIFTESVKLILTGFPFPHFVSFLTILPLPVIWHSLWFLHAPANAIFVLHYCLIFSTWNILLRF